MLALKLRFEQQLTEAVSHQGLFSGMNTTVLINPSIY